MLLHDTDAHNMRPYVTALIVQLTDIVTIAAADDIVAFDLLVADYADQRPYTLAADGPSTFDDLGDAIHYACVGADNTYAAINITSNYNYADDHRDLVIYSRVPITTTILHGA